MSFTEISTYVISSAACWIFNTFIKILGNIQIFTLHTIQSRINLDITCVSWLINFKFEYYLAKIWVKYANTHLMSGALWKVNETQCLMDDNRWNMTAIDHHEQFKFRWPKKGGSYALRVHSQLHVENFRCKKFSGMRAPEPRPAQGVYWPLLHPSLQGCHDLNCTSHIWCVKAFHELVHHKFLNFEQPWKRYWH